MTTQDITELDAAHAANGRLLAELEKLRSDHQSLLTLHRQTLDAYYEQKRRVSELEGKGAEDRLTALAGQIETEQKRLAAVVERRTACQTRLNELMVLTNEYVAKAIEITDGIG